jgi:hypothetical protein
MSINPESASRDAAVRQMRNIGLGPLLFQAVYAAARLGIADCLADGAKRAEDIAGAMNAPAASLYRLLRALGAAGILAEDEDGRFALTPAGELLRKDDPGSLHGWLMLMGADWQWRMLGQLEQAVRTGQAGAAIAFGMPFFEYVAGNAEASAVFDRAMTSQHQHSHAAIVAAYDFSVCRTIVDVGGGHGALLAAILGANQEARGILFDRPSVVEGVRAAFEKSGLAARCQLSGGDFFQGVPRGGDGYVLMTILHDWGDDKASVILGHIRRAIDEAGRLLIIEQVIPPGPLPHPGKLRDMSMLLLGGKERTEAEFRSILASAGFAVERAVPVGSVFDMSIIEARPA